MEEQRHTHWQTFLKTGDIEAYLRFRQAHIGRQGENDAP